MYIRPVHAEHDVPTLHSFIRENPLGILTTAIESPADPFLQSSHIPWILDAPDAAAGQLPFGTLRGHIARANPQAKAIVAELADGASRATAPRLARDVLVLFNAPAQHYVPPRFYAQTKPATGRVVPTWDYAAVQAYGRATVFVGGADAAADAFLARQVRDLTHFAETAVMGHACPWRVDDAPESYIALLTKAIVGIEVEITDMAGRWKMSQEMCAEDREGVVRGFEEMGTDIGKAMADMVRERAERAKRDTAR
jgi:transcriptional regulator